MASGSLKLFVKEKFKERSGNKESNHGYAGLHVERFHDVDKMRFPKSILRQFLNRDYLD
jgi:hypothetical protein